MKFEKKNAALTIIFIVFGTDCVLSPSRTPIISKSSGVIAAFNVDAAIPTEAQVSLHCSSANFFSYS
jgi:hypothetical protein